MRLVSGRSWTVGESITKQIETVDPLELLLLVDYNYMNVLLRGIGLRKESNSVNFRLQDCRTAKSLFI